MEKDNELKSVISLAVLCCANLAQHKDKIEDLVFSFQEIGKIAFEISKKTESVPETIFAQTLLECLCKNDVELFAGYMTDKEIKEVEEEIKKIFRFLEIFINPDFLFENGKIRPDVVFRKGIGNYLIFEIDSFQYHSNQQQLIKDKQRERKIESLGYPVFRFAAKEVLHEPWKTAEEAVAILKKKKFLL